DVDQFVNCVRYLSPAFGGINLEDIKAPECFMIEQRLRELLPIPVFHDDQHGTAIVAVAGLINALHLTGRRAEDVKMVVNGAGASAIACTELIKQLGVRHVLMCDTKGVIYQGRTSGMNQWKSAHAAVTDARTLEEAMVGADLFLGLSQKGAVSRAMVASMAPNPIIFAMANPDPEITPEEVAAVRSDAIVATGRSDYPNQVNNVLCFPYLFRGALDVRAVAINEEMKLAAAHALADLARQQVPDEVAAAYGGKAKTFGRDYIIPAPFDPRLIENIPVAVAKAAMASGVAKKPFFDEAAYRLQLRSRLNPTNAVLAGSFEAARAHPKRVVFAEGEQEIVLRAAVSFHANGYGEPVLIGREEPVRAGLARIGADPAAFRIHNSANSDLVPAMVETLYRRLQRRGHLLRDVERMVNHERNIFGALMLEMGEADAMVTGITRNFATTFRQVRHVLDPAPGHTPFGIHMYVGRSETIFIADTTVHERPTAEQVADIAMQTAAVARRLGQEPRVAFLSYSNFGNPPGEFLQHTRDAIALLDARQVGFEYEGEMSPDVALSPRMASRYPFSRLSAPANVLVMPGLQSANISAKLLKELGDGRMIGPLLMGMGRAVQIAPMTSGASEIVTMAVLAASGVVR
ncbi:MAG: NADP-dependent malic enzyme, partial [Sphingomonadaceae bacterium]|nr:NADP-dependent malic enzyme [Sphingomonadaceae bacterium]